MGLGFKDWSAGDVPTAAEFDGYLQRQTVMVFASTSARDTALSGALEEGMVAYNSDNDEFWTYTGSAWVLLTPHLAGVSVTRATDQTIGGGATTNITWSAETTDTDGFIAVSSDTITIPAGLGGIYMLTMSVRVTGGSGQVANSSLITIAGTSYRWTPGTGLPGAGNTDFVTYTWCGALDAADTITAAVTEDSVSSSVNIRAELELYRVGRI